MAVWASCRKAVPPGRSRVFPSKTCEVSEVSSRFEVWCGVCVGLDTLEARSWGMLGYVHVIELEAG